jgi:hypothetical protein
MALPNVLADSLFELGEGLPPGRSLGKQRVMDVLGRVRAGAPNYDVVPIFIPFEDRSGANAEPSAHFSGNRDLPLRRQL